MGDCRILVTRWRVRTCALGSRPRVVQENRRVFLDVQFSSGHARGLTCSRIVETGIYT